MKVTLIGTFFAIIILLVSQKNGYSSEGQLFKPFINYDIGSFPEAVAIGDVNGDGKNDVVMTTAFFYNPQNDYKIFVFIQNNDGVLNYPIKYSVSGKPTSVDICDLNNDGKKDVVVGNYDANNELFNIELFIQNQSGGLNPSVIYKTTNSLSIKTGDFNHDGLMDVAGIGWGLGSVNILFQKINGMLGTPITYSVKHEGYDELEAGDVNNDGLTDLIVMSGQGWSPNIGILYQQSDGFSPPRYYSVGSHILTHGVAVGDINNDKLNDVIVSYGGNQPTSFIGTFNQNSQGTLNAVVNYVAIDCPRSVGVADVNSDGKMDIIALNGGWRALSLYLQNGNGGMMPYSHYSLPYASTYNPQGLAIGDINSDGAVDAAIADYNNGLVILYNSHPVSPAVPSELTATGVTKNQINLKWTAVNGVTKYNIYRTTSQTETYTLVGDSSTNAYHDAELSANKTYWYKVSAVNRAGEGPQSTGVSGKALASSTIVAPSGLTATGVTKNQINLKWTAVNGATKYNIYRTTSQTGTYTYVGSSSTKAYSNSELSANTIYWYKVSAVDSAGEGSQSAGVSGKTLASSTIVAPSGLTATGVTKNQINLKWTAVNGATKYNIYRTSSQTRTYTYVGSSSTNAYSNAGLSASTNYGYKVSTVDGAGGEGPQSAGVSGKTTSTIAAPRGLAVTGVTRNQINLKWTAVTGAIKYNIYRTTSQTGLYTYIGTNTNACFDTGLSANTTYWYKVSAVDIAGEGSQSAGVSGKTLASST